MIWSVFPGNQRNWCLGIVNEKTFARAVEAARLRFGRVWLKDSWVEREIEVEPGETQLQ